MTTKEKLEILIQEIGEEEFIRIMKKFRFILNEEGEKIFKNRKKKKNFIEKLF